MKIITVTIYTILLITILFSCTSENANDCFQTNGSIVEKEIPISSFEKILVNRNITLILKQEDQFKVTIATGATLINDVEVVVHNNQLQLTDHNTCNYVRSYEATKIYVSAPNINEIRSSTQYTITNHGSLNYPNLKLISEDFNVPNSFTVGDFNLQVNCTKLVVTSNNISSYFISGSAEKLNVGFYSGTGRFEGANLIAQEVSFYHRGSNDIIVNPQLSLKGTLVGVGNVVAINQPETVEVEALYTGTLIFL